ncbi:MAG: zinc-binding dehydrogenase, partial [Myxococcales bacterium]|nr:zinc-binding dehydrogenase [Myxococcales bacterium]
MRAARIHAYGAPDVLQVDEVPDPEPGPRDLLVEVHASSINPVDYKIRSGGQRALIHYRLPWILGLDFSGVVRKVGAKVTRFQVGDEVYGSPTHRRPGCYAELLCVDERQAARKPRNMTHAEAASIPLVGMTAWGALVVQGRLRAGEKALITAGSGGVGSFAIQLAKSLGAHVATTCSARNAELVRSLGADEVIDYREQRVEEVLSGYDYVLDALGGEERERERERGEDLTDPPAAGAGADVGEEREGREGRADEAVAGGEPADVGRVGVVDRVDEEGEPGDLGGPPRPALPRGDLAVERARGDHQEQVPEQAVEVHERRRIRPERAVERVAEGREGAEEADLEGVAGPPRVDPALAPGVDLGRGPGADLEERRGIAGAVAEEEEIVEGEAVPERRAADQGGDDEEDHEAGARAREGGERPAEEASGRRSLGAGGGRVVHLDRGVTPAGRWFAWFACDNSRAQWRPRARRSRSSARSRGVASPGRSSPATRTRTRTRATARARASPRATTRRSPSTASPPSASSAAGRWGRSTWRATSSSAARSRSRC